MIRDHNQLRDLYITAYADGLLSQKEEQLIDDFVRQTDVLPQWVRIIKKSAKEEADKLVEQAINRPFKDDQAP